MKISIIIIFLIIFSLMAILSDGRDGRQGRELHITSLSIKFDKTDAVFTVNYDFDTFSEAYILLFGAKIIEPKVRSIFQDFEYEIIKIDPGKAILRVRNISVLNKGYYLHNSRRFGETVDTVYISDISDPRIKEYYNINSTPNYFYR